MSLDDPADVELHRLVATYVATRWPVAVALNKMDVPSAAMHELAVRERYPDRVIVPVSATAEEALLRAQVRRVCLPPYTYMYRYRYIYIYIYIYI